MMTRLPSGLLINLDRICFVMKHPQFIGQLLVSFGSDAIPLQGDDAAVVDDWASANRNELPPKAVEVLRAH